MIFSRMSLRVNQFGDPASNPDAAASAAALLANQARGAAGAGRDDQLGRHAASHQRFRRAASQPSSIRVTTATTTATAASDVRATPASPSTALRRRQRRLKAVTVVTVGLFLHQGDFYFQKNPFKTIFLHEVEEFQ